MQGMTKVEERDSIHQLPKSSSEPTAGEQVIRNQRPEPSSKVTPVELRFSQPAQQRSDTTVTESTGEFPAGHWHSGLVPVFQSVPLLVGCLLIMIVCGLIQSLKPTRGICHCNPLQSNLMTVQLVTLPPCIILQSACLSVYLSVCLSARMSQLEDGFNAPASTFMLLPLHTAVTLTFDLQNLIRSLMGGGLLNVHCTFC